MNTRALLATALPLVLLVILLPFATAVRYVSPTPEILPLPETPPAPPAEYDPDVQVQVYLKSLGYTVRRVRLYRETRAQVDMDMVSDAFDDYGKAQVVHGWYALAQAYPQATSLWSVVVYQDRYPIVFEVLAQDFRDWVDGKIGQEDLHYTHLVYNIQTDDLVRDKDFVHKNFAGTRPGRGQSLGPLPRLKFSNLWLIYRDDFSDELSGWDVSETEAVSAGYADGRYRIAIKAPETVHLATTSGNLRDFAIAVRAKQSSGDVRNAYGIAFCFQDDDNYCGFFVTAEGWYTILRKIAGDWKWIQPWTASTVLRQGQLENLLRVEVQGDEVRAYANGKLLTAVPEAGLAKGRVGLAAATSEALSTEVIFYDMALFGVGADWTGEPGAGGEPPHELQAVRREPVPAAAREALAALRSTEAPPVDYHDLEIRLGGRSPDTSRTLDMAPQYQVGNMETFYVWKKDKWVEVEARLVYETAHVRAWVEKGTNIDVDALKAATDEFENEIYEKDRSFFGSEWTPGIDGDVHIHVFNGNIPDVGGRFSQDNEYRKEVRRFSNEKEMFFINAVSVKPGTDGYAGTLAHEFQHMIHWNNKRGDDLWLDEGCAELAKHLNGIDPSDRAIAFGRYPDLQLNSFDQGQDTRTPHYGKSFLFVAYFLGRFGREKTQQIASGPGRGTTSFDKVLTDQNLTFDDIFDDWVIANFVNDPSLDAAYAYPSDVDAIRPRFAQAHQLYPVHEHTDVHQYAADYVKLEGQGSLRVDFTGSTVVPVGPGEAHSGDKIWWFGWGDNLNPKLTREFDLTNASNPRLEVWMWYDTVMNTGTKMYGFWSVSADGGMTWKQARVSTDGGVTWGRIMAGENWPHKRSGGGTTAQWIKHTVDLSKYAGRKVHVRFEVLSSLGKPVPGFAIDDITISGIDYSHDAEGDNDDGWVGEGFVRIMPKLPQRWTVQVIEMDGDKATNVRRVDLNHTNVGSITVDGLGESKWAVLVIAARTPYASDWAPYEYTVTQR